MFSFKNEFNKLAKKYSLLAFNKSLGLKYLSSLELSFIKKYLPKGGGAQLFLDLGIGNGRESNIMLQNGMRVVGVDFSKEMLKVSGKSLGKYLKDKRLKLIEADLNNRLPFPDAHFDGIICIRVIKYVKNWKQLIEEISRVVKSKGIFIVEFPNSYSVQNLSKLYSGYLTFKPSEFEKCLHSSGFKIIDKKYGVKLPFYIYVLINSQRWLRIVLAVESLLQKLFKSFLSRNVMIYCQS